MVRYSCPACKAGVELPAPPVPGQTIACPACRTSMAEDRPPPAPKPRVRARDTTWKLRTQIRVLGGVVVLFWALVIIDWFLPKGQSLVQYGIQPHQPRSLIDIFFAPFLHDGFVHVFTNSLGFAVLGWLVLVRSSRQFLLVSLVAAIVSGLGIWIFGKTDTPVVGASGVIFGYLGFLLARGFFERSFKSFLVTIVVAGAFSSLLWGILPFQAGVSWQGHLFGFLGGALTARLLVQRRQLG